MTDDDDEERPDLLADLSPADRQMVRALTTVESARKGVTVLRVIAAIVVLAAVVGQGIILLDLDWSSGGSGSGLLEEADTPVLEQWAYFLAALAVPLAFAGLLVAASYLLSVYASRLDMDIVLAELDEPGDD